MTGTDVEVELRRLGGIDGAISLLRHHRAGTATAATSDEVQAGRLELGAALLACAIGLGTATTTTAAAAVAAVDDDGAAADNAAADAIAIPPDAAASAGTTGVMTTAQGSQCASGGAGAATMMVLGGAQRGDAVSAFSTTEEKSIAAACSGRGRTACIPAAAASWKQKALASALQALQGACGIACRIVCAAC